MGKTLNCILIDDEELYLQLMKEYITQTPFLHLVKSYDSALDALKEIDDLAIDLVITDVRLPELTGTQLAKVLNKKALFVLTSSFDEYALTGYEVDAIDFLLKPFGYDRFLKACLKAQQQIDLLQGLAAPAGQHSLSIFNKDTLVFKSSGKVIRVLLSEVLFIEARKEYACIVTLNRGKIMTLSGIGTIEETLEHKGFVRVHKSFLVNLRHIEEIEQRMIKIKEYVIPVANSYKQQFFSEMQKNDIDLNLTYKKNN